MRRLPAVVGLLAGSLAVAGAATGAAAEPWRTPLPGADTASADHAPRFTPAPSLRSLNRSGGSARSYSPWLSANAPAGANEPTNRVRTMCVRLCDGYYWPMSVDVDRWHVSRDASACASSCRSEARLFILPRSSADIGAMTDLTGRVYAGLDTAFHYRKALKPGCGCQPAPWSGAAQMRHARYAEAEAVAEARRRAGTSPSRAEAGSVSARRPGPAAAPEADAPAFFTPPDAASRTPTRARSRRQHVLSSSDRRGASRHSATRGLFAW